MKILELITAKRKAATQWFPIKDFEGDLWHMNEEGTQNSLAAGDVGMTLAPYFARLDPKTVEAMENVIRNANRSWLSRDLIDSQKEVDCDAFEDLGKALKALEQIKLSEHGGEDE